MEKTGNIQSFSDNIKNQNVAQTNAVPETAPEATAAPSAPESDGKEQESDGLEDEMQEREMAATFSSEPEMDELEPQYDESEMDEPGTKYDELEMEEPEKQYDESERPTPDVDIQQALQSKLEKDFGELPPNVVIGGIPDHNFGSRSGTAAGLGR